jgi:hypothetical protein
MSYSIPKVYVVAAAVAATSAVVAAAPAAALSIHVGMAHAGISCLWLRDHDKK